MESRGKSRKISYVDKLIRTAVESLKGNFLAIRTVIAVYFRSNFLVLPKDNCSAR
jgi:hypothetical protein